MLISYCATTKRRRSLKGVFLLGVAMSCWQAGTTSAGVTDIPISQATYIDSLYTTQNFFDQNLKLVQNAASHDAGTMTCGLIALPQLPNIPAADVYSVNIWMCQTYCYTPYESPYYRGVLLYPLTQNYDLTTVTWQSCNGGQYDSSNPVPWNPASGMASGFDGYWWCSWNITSLINNSNLLNNGAILMMDPAIPLPQSKWVTKDFAGATYGLTQYQPFVEVVQMDQWNDTSGNWSTAANWNTGTPSNAIDAVAGFLGNATRNRTVTVDSPVTVGGIVFDNAAYSYTVTGSGGNSITMSSLSGTATITDNNGRHAISAPLVLASDLTITVVNASDTLTLSGDVQRHRRLD